jgi:glycosyltransferase involved in cell wall biosynthesis
VRTLRLIGGAYRDNWLGLDAMLALPEAAGQVVLRLYLPAREGAPAEKLVSVVHDGAMSCCRLARDQVTEVVVRSSESGPSVVRVLAEYPEPNIDGRTLGVFLALAALDGNSRNLPIAFGPERSSDIAIAPDLPDFWIVGRIFDREHYLSALDGEVIHHDPLVHFLAFGRHRGLSPAPGFAPVALAPSADVTSGTLLEEAERLRWLRQACELLSAVGMAGPRLDDEHFSRYVIWLFDPEVYRATSGLPDDATPVELLTRYLAVDYPRGAAPGPMFDADHYAAELARLGLRCPPGEPPFRHWLKVGVARRISPTPLFDAAEYLALNPDLKTYPDWLFDHWLRLGIQAGRAFDNNLRFARDSQQLSASQSAAARWEVIRRLARAPGAAADLHAMRTARRSDAFRSLVEAAAAIDPNVPAVDERTPSMVPPFHDDDYAAFRQVVDVLPAEGCDALVLMPFGKLGGADFVAGVLATTLHDGGSRTVVLRTDAEDWERPDWFPYEVTTVDISSLLPPQPPRLRQRILYEVIRRLAPRAVFNVNSRLAFDTFATYGARLRLFTDLYCYYFCADRTAEGRETGYPVWYFAPLLPNLSGALIDTRYLADVLTERYALGPDQAAKLHVLYTPAMQQSPERPLVEAQVETAGRRRRPLVLWAGRLDQQKRFDIVVDVARAMPQVDFQCWGKAVLDEAPDLSALPSNLTLNAPFRDYEELPLADSDAWLYTADWDGMPTILIEIGQMGVPIVATAAGGIPELIDEDTGWPVPVGSGAPVYVEALRSMLADPEERRRRATRLCERVRARHTREAYAAGIRTMIGEAGDA